MSKPTILIIGAGIAGLAAARELSKIYKVIVLEGQPRIGGRIHTLLPEGLPVIEAGAEFIHGNTPLTLKIMKEAGIKTIPVKGAMYRKEGGKWNEQDEMIEGWDKLIKQMKRIDHDTTLAEFLHRYYNKEDQANFRRHIIAFAQGFDVADPGKVSVKSLYKEWVKTDEQNSRVDGGYIRLVEFLYQQCLAAGCKILTDHTIKQIDWQENEVTVYTMNDRFTGDKLIVTVPASILQTTLGTASINFTPPIDDYIRAASHVGFGTAIKIVADFQRSFWKEDTGFIFSDEMIPTWWTQFPVASSLLTGWAGGPVAARMSELGDDEISEKALLSLAAIFDLPLGAIKQNLRQLWVFNWSKASHTSGAYSYATPSSAEARKLLNTPLANTVFFAGESVHDGDFPGTVEAALTSGTATALRVARLLK